MSKKLALIVLTVFALVILVVMIFFYTSMPVLMTISVYQVNTNLPAGTSMEEKLKPMLNTIEKIVGQSVKFDSVAYIPESTPTNPPLVVSNSFEVNNYSSASEIRNDILAAIKSGNLGNVNIEVSSPFYLFLKKCRIFFYYIGINI